LRARTAAHTALPTTSGRYQDAAAEENVRALRAEAKNG